MSESNAFVRRLPLIIILIVAVLGYVLLPAVPFFMANLIPSFLEVPLRRFVISTFFGIMPGTFVFTLVGAGLGEVFARGETPNLGIIFEPAVLLPILGLALLAVLPVIIKAVRGKKGL